MGKQKSPRGVSPGLFYFPMENKKVLVVSSCLCNIIISIFENSLKSHFKKFCALVFLGFRFGFALLLLLWKIHKIAVVKIALLQLYSCFTLALNIRQIAVSQNYFILALQLLFSCFNPILHGGWFTEPPLVDDLS